MSYFNELDNTQLDIASLSDIGRLRQIASPYCPEELRQTASDIIPATDELDLSAIKSEFDRLLRGEDVWSDNIPAIEGLDLGLTKGTAVPSTVDDSTPKYVPDNKGFGIGIPEIDKVSMINYEETDTINSQSVRSDFPVLSQQVNGKPLVWFDNGATNSLLGRAAEI